MLRYSGKKHQSAKKVYRKFIGNTIYRKPQPEKAGDSVPKIGLEPTRPYGHYTLNVARLPISPLGQ